MFDFLKFLNKQPASKDVAKERLRLVLIQDRGSNVDPQILEQLKNDIIKVINKYLDVDEQALEIELTKPETECTAEGKNFSQALVANIPIKGIKRPND
jgi:cell division topological specificity factor